MDKKAQLLELLQQKKKEKELATPIGILGTKLDKVVEAVSSIPQIEIPEYPEHPSYPEFPKSMEMSFKGLQTVTLKGDKGDTGDTYTLTEKDKRDIALAIKVPIVEKVIEKTETIIEKPIVTQEIKEVAISDTADTIRNKLELLKGDERLKLDAISGVDKLRNGLLDVMNQGLMSLDKFHGLGIAQSGVKIGNANEINFIGATVKNNSNQGVDVTISASSGGITSINTDTTAAQTLTVGTSGNDFAIADNGTGDHKFNLPTASATKRGALSSADWSTFNSKGNGTVTSVSGTANRITSTGGTTPAVDISASYVGQGSITTVGTLSSGSIPYSLLTGTPTIPTGANPTVSVGLSVVNGSAATFMRSDGAPALSQAIAPTWTGVHTFTPAARTSGTASYLTVNAPADTGITTATESIGINHVGGTRTWVDGTVATQREYFFGKPTYNKTTTAATFTNAYTAYIEGNPVAGSGVTITNPWALGIGGNIKQNGRYVQLGNVAPNNTGLSAATSAGFEFWGSENNINGVQMGVGNTSSGTSAYGFLFMNNDLSVSNDATHYSGIGYTSSGYTDTTFGTALAVANQLQFLNTDGALTYATAKTTTVGFHNWLVGGFATTNEVMRATNTGLTVGLAATLTGAVTFAGATSGGIKVQGIAIGGSSVNTLQAVTDTFVYKATTDTLTNKTLTDAVNTVSAPGTTSVGYLGIPQNSKSAAYTTVMADAGKHILHPSGDANARTFTIDSNANVAYPIGTTITFVNQTSQVLSIAITTDTMTLANSTTTGTRSLAQNGMATALKVTATAWIISGVGLT